MTDEQIALIKYAIRAENKKTAQVLGKLKVPVDDYKSPLAKALCAALALAEQAWAMEGWSLSDYALEKNGFFITESVYYDKDSWCVKNKGKWLKNTENGSEHFITLLSAMCVANAAMKAGKA